MSRNLIKILIGIWTCIALVLTVFLVYNISYNRSAGDAFRIFKWDNNSMLTVQKDESISIDNFNKIEVNFSSADIIVQSTDESNLRIVQKSRGKLKEEEKFAINKENNSILVKRTTSHKVFSIFNIGNLQESIEIYIPKNYAKDLDIQSSSGNIIFNSNINLNNISCVARSGNLQSETNINANNINLKANSGNINVENLMSKSYKVNTSSGNIHIGSISGSGEVTASSGNVRISYKDISEYSNVSANSGNVNLVVPEGLSFEFNGECNSGDIDSNFDLNYKNKRGNEATGQVGSAPYKKINVTTSSGNIDISK
ncbi:DUF4097 family beta strand repeat-containing protein [Clostridium pasteurianum]|uniref:DUF4097 family beta strand repeat-containing protein n=1 Tax=Clostridium pasteurianum TaxID=1501 RepID=UPI002260A1CA|nr:DUF4097 family beta strand repeat-containing protein [Clostridium pasteurianum]UZW14163.1 DUF4097 family beta strand repeat-containing protein [Clostridium pasteurianum]